MKKALLILFGIVLTVLLVVAIVVVTVMIDRNNNKSQVIDSDNSGVVNEEGNTEVPLSCDIDTANAAEEASGFEYDFSYPAFTCTDQETEDTLNSYVEDAIASFTDSIEEGDDENLRSVGHSDYDVLLNDNNRISVRINYSVNLMGGTGDSGIIPVNFDLETGNFLELSDLFVGNSDYLNQISDYSINSLKEQLDSDSLNDQIESGASADDSNYKTFVFDDSSVTVVFGKYQVGPGALGNPEVVIPFTEIN